MESPIGPPGPNQSDKSLLVDLLVDCSRSVWIGMLEETRIDALVRQEQSAQLSFQELGGF